MATNRIETLDPALIRPGRIDRKIEFPLPDEKTKRRIFQIHTSRMTLSDDVNLDELIMAKDDLSGADIKVWHARACYKLLLLIILFLLFSFLFSSYVILFLIVASAHSAVSLLFYIFFLWLVSIAGFLGNAGLPLKSTSVDGRK